MTSLIGALLAYGKDRLKYYRLTPAGAAQKKEAHVKTLADFNPYGITQGVYPYPKECVFIAVLGTPDGHIGFRYGVGRRPECAERILGICPHPWELWGVFSLKDFEDGKGPKDDTREEIIHELNKARLGLKDDALYCADLDNGERVMSLEK